MLGRGALDGLCAPEVSVWGAAAHSGGEQSPAKQFNVDTLLRAERCRCGEESPSFLEVSILMIVTATKGDDCDERSASDY